MASTLKVRFNEAYKNGVIGLDIPADTVVELDRRTYDQVVQDVRHPHDFLTILEEETISEVSEVLGKQFGAPLEAAGFETLASLEGMTDEELDAIPGIGAAGKAAIRAHVAAPDPVDDDEPADDDEPSDDEPVDEEDGDDEAGEGEADEADEG